MNQIWDADLGDGTYQNPILFADYSDPDVIRVDDIYYMTASSFNYVPGLPILISKDMIHWKLSNYALERIPGERFDTPRHSEGVWAPSIRYHEGTFFIVYGMPDEGIYVVKTKDPLGKWEEPILLLPGKGLIDPCPYWDEDGRAYIVHAYAKSRIGFNSILGLFEVSPDCESVLGEDHFIFDGRETQITLEGPKVYKRDDFYYILAPAGGVRQGWQTALRSKNIRGPYEEMIVMRQGKAKTNGPHQGALVSDDDGRDWFFHFQDRGLYGRILHLQPVTWQDGWPCMGENIEDYCGEPVDVYEKPVIHIAEDSAQSREFGLAASDSFENGELGLQWQWTGNSKKEFAEFPESGVLRLFGQQNTGEEVLWYQSNLLTQKILCPSFAASVQVDAEKLFGDGDRAGILMMGGEYTYLAVKRNNHELDLVYGISGEQDKPDFCRESDAFFVAKKIEKEEILERDISDKLELSLSLRQNSEGGVEFAMSYKGKDDRWIPVEAAGAFVPSDHTWVGAKIGLFALGSGSCDFKQFLVQKIGE